MRLGKTTLQDLEKLSLAAACWNIWRHFLIFFCWNKKVGSLWEISIFLTEFNLTSHLSLKIISWSHVSQRFKLSFGSCRFLGNQLILSWQIFNLKNRWKKTIEICKMSLPRRDYCSHFSILPITPSGSLHGL